MHGLVREVDATIERMRNKRTVKRVYLVGVCKHKYLGAKSVGINHAYEKIPQLLVVIAI